MGAGLWTHWLLEHDSLGCCGHVMSFLLRNFMSCLSHHTLMYQTLGEHHHLGFFPLYNAVHLSLSCCLVDFFQCDFGVKLVNPSLLCLVYVQVARVIPIFTAMKFFLILDVFSMSIWLWEFNQEITLWKCLSEKSAESVERSPLCHQMEIMSW